MVFSIEVPTISPLKNFIVVGTQRTGSSALAELLGLNTCIACGWEWAVRLPMRNKIEVCKNALDGNFNVLLQDDKIHM